MEYQIRTDLAIENREMYKTAQKIDDEVPGVKTVVDDSDADMLVTKVEIMSKEASEALGKPQGVYVTIESQKLKEDDEEVHEKISKRVSDTIKEMGKLKEGDTVCVVGLGNRNVTADALGPKVISDVDITRHLLSYMPEYVLPGTRSVCAIAPGVLGTTGIETGEIIKGVTEKVRPNLIIALDALASRKMERVSTTIQISNTGITPGAGIGNNRNAINEEILGIPVIAIGVPTVVDAATIASDTLDLMIAKLKGDDSKSSELVSRIEEQDKYSYIKEVLSPGELNYVVTPSEIDEIITNTARVLAEGINMALQPAP
ncbi:MAG: GPR endopeptidase [Clostridia bacterium]|nr:GPR endopeptidase [Clostridia bacterium]